MKNCGSTPITGPPAAITLRASTPIKPLAEPPFPLEGLRADAPGAQAREGGEA